MYHVSSIMNSYDQLWPIIIRWWKTSFSGRWPLVEDDLWWKTTFGGWQPSVEDNLQLKTTFSCWQPSVEDNLWWKMTFSGRQPWVEDTLLWKMTFRGRWPLVENVICWRSCLTCLGHSGGLIQCPSRNFAWHLSFKLVLKSYHPATKVRLSLLILVFDAK